MADDQTKTEPLAPPRLHLAAKATGAYSRDPVRHDGRAGVPKRYPGVATYEAGYASGQRTRALFDGDK